MLFGCLLQSTTAEQLVWGTYKGVRRPGVLMDKTSASMTDCEMGRRVVECFPLGNHGWTKFELENKVFSPYNHVDGGAEWSKSLADRSRKLCISKSVASGKAWDHMMEEANKVGC